MGVGDLGKVGVLAPSHVVVECMPENAIAITQRQNMEERTVIRMDLAMKCLRPVIPPHALVSEIFWS